MSHPTVVVAGYPPLAEALAASGRFAAVVPVSSTSELQGEVGKLNALPPNQLVFLFADTVTVDTDVKLPRMLDYLSTRDYPTVVLDVSGKASALVDSSPAVGLLGGRLTTNLVLGAIANLENGPVLEPVAEGHAPLPPPDGTFAAYEQPQQPGAEDPFGGPSAPQAPAAAPFDAQPQQPAPQQPAPQEQTPASGPFGAQPQQPAPQQPAPQEQTPASGPFGAQPQQTAPQEQTPAAGPFGAQPPADRPEPQGRSAGGPFGSSGDAAPSSPFDVAAGQPTAPSGDVASPAPQEGPQPAPAEPVGGASGEPSPFGEVVDETPEVGLPFNDGPQDPAAHTGGQPAPAPQEQPAPQQPAPQEQTPASGPFGAQPQQTAPQEQTPAAGPFGAQPQPAPAPQEQTPAAGPFGAQPQPAPAPQQPAEQDDNTQAYGAGPFSAPQAAPSSPFSGTAQVNEPAPAGGIAPLDTRPQHQATQKRRGKLVAVVAPKGGVGKSAISANLGAHAGIRLRDSKPPLNAITVDANLGNPDVGKYLNRLFPTIAELGRTRGQITPEVIDKATVKFPEMNFDALLGPAKLDQTNPQWMRGSFFRHITDVMRDMYDLIVVDTPVAELVHDLFDDFVLKSADYLIVVTAPNRATLDDTADYLSTITAPVHTPAGRGIPREKVGYILNRAEEDINCSIDDVRHELSDWNMIAAIFESKAWKRYANDRVLAAGRRHPEINQAFDMALHAATGWDEFLNPTAGEQPTAEDEGGIGKIFKRLFR